MASVTYDRVTKRFGAETVAVRDFSLVVQDGECLIGHCGASCVRWDQPLGSPWCEDIGRLEEPPVTYCGCVAGRCDWFRVAQ